MMEGALKYGHYYKGGSAIAESMLDEFFADIGCSRFDDRDWDLY